MENSVLERYRDLKTLIVNRKEQFDINLIEEGISMICIY